MRIVLYSKFRIKLRKERQKVYKACEEIFWKDTEERLNKCFKEEFNKVMEVVRNEV